MKKKNLITTSLAVILAVALTAGGTLAYLNGTSVTATNVVDNDFNWVSLTETDTPVENGISTDDDGNITNTGYEIIPGTSQDKDPTVSVSYSVDSYVYVEVTDTSGGLITWAPADGWTLLESASDTEKGYYVYYRLVQEADTGTTSGTESGVTYYKNSFSVLDGDSISYDSSITNSDLVSEFSATGDPTFTNTDIKLAFQAYIMQADITGTNGSEYGVNESALACWYAMNGVVAIDTDGTTYTSLDDAVTASNVAAIYDEEDGVYVVYSSLSSAISAVGDNETIVMFADSSSTSTVYVSKNVTIDLNGCSVSDSIYLSSGSLVINDNSENSTGTMSGTVNAGGTGTSITINGGTFATSTDVRVKADGTNASLTINGGTFRRYI